MVNQKVKSLVLLFSLALLMGIGMISMSLSAPVPKTSGSTPMENIVVDGVINEAEFIIKRNPLITL